MLVGEAKAVQDMLIERLRAAHLEGVVRPENSHCLDMEDSVWLEVVLSDGARLEYLEAIVAEVKDTFGARGIRVDSIVSAVWAVTDVQSRGPAYGKDGAPRAAEEFHVTLQSGERVETVAVAVTLGATAAIRASLDAEAPTGKAQNNLVRVKVVALIRKFVEYELRQGGLGYWNPLKHPRRELNEPAASFFSAHRD